MHKIGYVGDRSSAFEMEYGRALANAEWADNTTAWSAQVSYVVELSGANAMIASTAEHADPQAAIDAAFDGLPAALARRRLMRAEELRAEAEALDQKATAIRATADALERSCG